MVCQKQLQRFDATISKLDFTIYSRKAVVNIIPPAYILVWDTSMRMYTYAWNIMVLAWVLYVICSLCFWAIFSHDTYSFMCAYQFACFF